MKVIKYSILLLTGLTLFGSCKEKEESTSESKEQKVSVEVMTIGKEDYSRFFTTSGKVEAENTTNVSTRMMGYVEEIYVKLGSNVKKGQLLLRIKSSDLVAKRAQVNSKISEANSALAIAEKDFNRMSVLSKKNSVSQKEMDDVRTHYEMSKARLANAQSMRLEVESQFNYANIRAPFSGVITNKFVQLGSLSNPGMPLVSIESEGKFQIMTRVSESEIANVKLDSDVDVSIKAIDNTVKGKVLEISSSGMNTGGQYVVKILLLGESYKLFSGMSATVAFPKESIAGENLILIDRSALVKRGQLTGVYTVSQSNTSLLRWIRLGRTYGSKVEVLSGLSFDEKYIVSSKGKLFNGALITFK